MNESLQKYARQTLKDGLSKLPDGWQNKFKLMYGRKSVKQNMEDILLTPIDDVVDKMDESKLDWAMTQVENSLRKTEK